MTLVAIAKQWRDEEISLEEARKLVAELPPVHFERDSEDSYVVGDEDNTTVAVYAELQAADATEFLRAVYPQLEA